jgi:predicted nucleotidyltransferase component of viral defense system
LIDRREILEAASSLALLPSVVEKDYVLGWMLAGINAHERLTDSWVFKGGTCLKKCYFETYRFSEDLDFTLRDESQLTEAFLRPVLGEVVEWVSEQSGLTMPADQLVFDFYTNPRGRPSCQGKIAYRGPVSPTSGGWPKIKLDLTADERIVLPSVEREVFQPYTDRPDDGIAINSYAYEEAFAEKMRALGERTRPRDLYDVVNLYRHDDTRPSPAILLNVLQQKCAYKGIPVPSLAALTPHRGDLGVMWQDMLGHQLPSLPSLTDFWDALPEIFDWIMRGVERPLQAQIQHGAGETAIRSRVLPMAIPVRGRSILEIIRFAAANHLCVDLTYDGTIRSIEPYSLRQTQAGDFVLKAIKHATGEDRTYRVDKMARAQVTSQPFTPRYLIELTQSGPMPVAAASSTPRVTHSRASRSGPVYVFRCTVCDKQFNRREMDATLNAHKNRSGQPCYGRYGTFVRTKW